MIDKHLAIAFNFNKLHNAYLINVDNSNLALDEILNFLRQYLYQGVNIFLNHPDFMLIQKGEDNIENISIQQIRKLQDFLNKTPIISNYKIAIVKEAESMTLSAANSCLKILEDVNGNSCIFLITTNVASILPTIRSRCRKIRYNYTIHTTYTSECVSDYYIKPFLTTTIVDEHLIYLADLKCKGKKLWSNLTTNAENLIIKLCKKLLNLTVIFSDLEKKLFDQIKFLSINHLIIKYDCLVKLANDTIESDLDLRASYILLTNLLKSETNSY